MKPGDDSDLNGTEPFSNSEYNCLNCGGRLEYNYFKDRGQDKGKIYRYLCKNPACYVEGINILTVSPAEIVSTPPDTDTKKEVPKQPEDPELDPDTIIYIIDGAGTSGIFLNQLEKQAKLHRFKAPQVREILEGLLEQGAILRNDKGKFLHYKYEVERLFLEATIQSKPPGLSISEFIENEGFSQLHEDYLTTLVDKLITHQQIKLSDDGERYTHYYDDHIDIDILSSSIPRSRVMKQSKVYSMLQDAGAEGISWDELVERVKVEHDIDKMELEMLLNNIREEGNVYEPQKGVFRTTRGGL